MKFKLSGNLARFVDYKRELEIDVSAANTVNQAVQELVKHYPNLQEIIHDKNGDIKKGYLISLNGQKVDLTQLDKRVSNDGCIDIFTAVAGG